MTKVTWQNKLLSKLLNVHNGKQSILLRCQIYCWLTDLIRVNEQIPRFFFIKTSVGKINKDDVKKVFHGESKK